MLNLVSRKVLTHHEELSLQNSEDELDRFMEGYVEHQADSSDNESEHKSNRSDISISSITMSDEGSLNQHQTISLGRLAPDSLTQDGLPNNTRGENVGEMSVSTMTSDGVPNTTEESVKVTSLSTNAEYTAILLSKIIIFQKHSQISGIFLRK